MTLKGLRLAASLPAESLNGGKLRSWISSPHYPNLLETPVDSKFCCYKENGNKEAGYIILLLIVVIIAVGYSVPR